MAKHSEQKEANDSEIISDREVCSAIRYLDPESALREGVLGKVNASGVRECFVQISRDGDIVCV